jgi:hypothetical protein
VVERQVYLVPTRHASKEDADSIAGRLRTIRNKEKNFVVAIEDNDKPESYQKLKKESDKDLSESFASRRNRNFKIAEYITYRELIKDGILIFGIDSPPEEKRKAFFLFNQAEQILRTINIHTKIDGQLNIASKGLTLRKKSNDIREKNMVDNTLELYRTIELPIVVILGGSHVFNLTDEFSKYVPITFMADKVEGTKRLETASIQFANKSMKSIEKFVAKDNLSLTKYILLENISRDGLGKLRENPPEEYLDRVLDAGSIKELNNIFKDLQSFDRKGLNGKIRYLLRKVLERSTNPYVKAAKEHFE